MHNDKTYLGDGVYAVFDGYQIIITTDRENGTHWIALEPAVLSSLVAYAERIYK